MKDVDEKDEQQGAKDAEMKDAAELEDSDEDDEEEELDEPEDKEEPPKMELDAEEKKIKFRQKPISDLTSYNLSTAFTKFVLPEADQGFDEIKYEWHKNRTKCLEYLKSWNLEKKNTPR